MIKRERIELQRRPEVFAGIDIAEERHVVRFIDNLGFEIGKTMSFSNNLDGFSQLERYAQETGYDNQAITFCLEPSGDYWKPLAYYLKEKRYSVVLVNPYHTRQSKELIDNSQTKNDRKDAYLIADLGKQGKCFPVNLPKGELAELREVTLAWRRTNKLLVQSKAYLSNFLTKYFPEYKGCFSDVFGKTSVYCLSHFPLPDAILHLGLKRLRSILKKRSRGKFSDKKIALLYQKAQTSIGMKEGSHTAKWALRDVLKDIEMLLQRKQKIKERMVFYLSCSGYQESLLSIPGVGVITGCFFLTEVGDPQRYSKATQIEKLAGLHLVENSSGKHHGKFAISKRGKSLLRYIGYQVALSAIAGNQEIRKLYAYRLAKTMNPRHEKMKIMTYLAAKMLRIMFIVCKNNTVYQPQEITKYWKETNAYYGQQGETVLDH